MPSLDTVRERAHDYFLHAAASSHAFSDMRSAVEELEREGHPDAPLARAFLDRVSRAHVAYNAATGQYSASADGVTISCHGTPQPS